MKKIILCLVVLALVYVGFSGLNSYGKEENYADKGIVFNEKSILGEKLVLANNTVDYDNYYVVRFFNGNYIIHSYYYLDSIEEYIKVYQDFSEYIVDYNQDDLMIRCVLDTGNMSYYDFYESYADLINNKTFSVIY